MSKEKKIVMTLDAGGTNFVFSAIQNYQEIVEPVRLPSNGNNLDKCLKNIVDGFKQIQKKLPKAPSAISFAFPGPADYPNGIIGDLVNLPGFRGGVPVGPMLEDLFAIPAFINNDGDLFTFGEASHGLLPFVNQKLQKISSPKQYKNLLGITLGTGFGAGIVRNGELFIGDNAAAAEIWPFPNKQHPDMSAEASISIRGIRHEYAKLVNIDFENAPEPHEIYSIAKGLQVGEADAANAAFTIFSKCLGNALTFASTLIDGIIVIGGGLAGAADLILPQVVDEMNSTIRDWDNEMPRMESRAFNLEDPQELQTFLKGDVQDIRIPGTDKVMPYDPLKRVGVGMSKLGTSEAMHVGAYAFALQQLKN